MLTGRQTDRQTDEVTNTTENNTTLDCRAGGKNCICIISKSGLSRTPGQQDAPFSLHWL